MADTKQTKQTETVEKTIIRPEDLAKELGMKDAKRIRAFLRSEFTRSDEEKNTSWSLTAKQADAVRARFTPKDEDSDES